MDASFVESSLKYHPGQSGCSNLGPVIRVRGQCLVGSLTGAVAS